MRILVLGSTGMLGHKMVERLQLYYEDVQGISRKDGFSALDLFETPGILDAFKPTVIINCIGLIKQRPQPPEKSIFVNALFPHFLQRQCSKMGTRLIHFSTDCVFSGRGGKYTEFCISDADDLYGRTKYLGEVISENALTLRTSIIGRERENFHGLLEWFLRQEGIVSGFQRVFYTGVTTNWLADIVAELINKPLSGLYHVASPIISKHYLLSLFKEAYQKDIKINPVSEPLCDRSLNGEKFQQATGIIVPSLREMVFQQQKQDLRSGYAI